jgi:hypothetical protein
MDVGKLLGVFRDEIGIKPQDIVDDLHLPVAARARPDADGRDGKPAGNQSGEGGGNRFQYDGVGARLLNGLGIPDNLKRRLFGPSLNPEPSQLVDGLGSQTGIPESTMRLIFSATVTPPSSLMDWQPPSWRKRPALVTACSTLTW